MTIRQLYINTLIGKIVLPKHKKTHSQFDKTENELFYKTVEELKKCHPILFPI